jgi:hypothetical protein
LFFFIRKATPLLSLPATSRLRPMTLSQSNFDLARSQAPVLLVGELLHELGVGQQALEGMQPQLRQTPPSLARSMQAVL